MEEECAKRGLSVKIRNAEPYREFQNSEDNDRYYGINEGYWRNQAVNPLNLPQGPVAQVAQVCRDLGIDREANNVTNAKWRSYSN